MVDSGELATRALHYGLAHNSRVCVLALLGASLHGVAGIANRFAADRATFKRVMLSDVFVAVADLNRAFAHVRIELALTEHALIVLSIAGAMASDAELFASLAALRSAAAADSPDSAVVASDAFDSSAASSAAPAATASSSSSSSSAVDFDRWMAAKEREHTRALLYLFRVAHVVALCHDGPSLDVVSLRHLGTVLELKRSLAGPLGAFLAQQDAASDNRGPDSKAMVMPGHITPVFCAVFAVSEDDVGSAANLKTLRNALSTQFAAMVRAFGLDCEPQRLVQLGKQSVLIVKADAAFSGGDSSDPLCASALLRGDFSLADDDAPATATWEGDALTARLISKMIYDSQERMRKPPKSKGRLGSNSHHHQQHHHQHHHKMQEDGEPVLPMCRRWFSSAVTLQSFLLSDAALRAVDAVDARPEQLLSQQICKDAMRAAREHFAALTSSAHDERVRAATALYDRMACGSSRSAFADKLRAALLSDKQAQK